MITLLLAAIDSFGTADFEALYLGTFLIDLALCDVLEAKYKSKEG